MPETSLSAKLAAHLTNLNTQDPRFIRELLDSHYTINNLDVNVITNGPDPQGVERGGFLGVLNGFLDTIGESRIAYEKVSDEAGAILGFVPWKPTTKLIQVEGIEVEVPVDIPEKDLEGLKVVIKASGSAGTDTVYLNYPARVVKLPEGVHLLMISAPGIPLQELAALRAHMDEAQRDPNYTIVTNYVIELSGALSDSLKA